MFLVNTIWAGFSNDIFKVLKQNPTTCIFEKYAQQKSCNFLTRIGQFEYSTQLQENKNNWQISWKMKT